MQSFPVALKMRCPIFGPSDFIDDALHHFYLSTEEKNDV
jgi:hypothetical protein